MNNKNNSNNFSNVKYISLETAIPYDWDDYDMYCDIFLEISTGKIVDKYYGHGEYDTFPKDEIMPYKTAIDLGLITSDISAGEITGGDNPCGDYDSRLYILKAE